MSLRTESSKMFPSQHDAMCPSEHGIMLLFPVFQCLDFEYLQYRTMLSSSYSLLIPKVQTKAATPSPYLKGQ